MERQSDTKLWKAVQLLDDAIELAISLKTSNNNIPALKRVVLDRLHGDLRKTRGLLNEELQKNLPNGHHSWQLVGKLLDIIAKYAFKLLINTALLCKLSSLKRFGKYMSIGKIIKLLRINIGLKQKDLANKLGISANYLSSVENGKREPSLSLLKTLSNELDVPLSFLFIESTDEFKNVPKQQRKKYQKLKDLLFEIQKLRMNQAQS